MPNNNTVIIFISKNSRLHLITTTTTISSQLPQGASVGDKGVGVDPLSVVSLLRWWRWSSPHHHLLRRGFPSWLLLLFFIVNLHCCHPRHGQLSSNCLTSHTVSHVTLLVSSGKFMGGSAFFLSPPENKKAKFAFCTLKRKGGSTQKQPFLTVRFRGALLTKSVTLEFSQDTVWWAIHLRTQ